MKFRYARHTDQLADIIRFYTEITGLEVLGGFKDHDGYDGVFLGIKGENWHLEFTTSHDKPNHHFDDDDMLVFYIESQLELDTISEIIHHQNIPLVIPKNPYWQQNAVVVSDPDGYPVAFTLTKRPLMSDDILTDLARRQGLDDWDALISAVRQLPYGRNHERSDLSLVLKEQKGTCSSKHAFLKKMADLNRIDDVQLILGLYRMNHKNTPKIGNELEQNGLSYIPEAHCFLKINHRRYDLTTLQSDINTIRPDILEEIEIQPEQVATFKVTYHQSYLQKWLKDQNIPMTFGQLWQIRENCIKRLEE